MWTTIITLALKLIGEVIIKNGNDKEAERKFLELATHLQGKKLISANFKMDRYSRLTELEKKRQEARDLANNKTT